MRKAIVTGIFIGAFQSLLFSQVLNTGTVLAPGSFSLSIAPVITINHNNGLSLFLAGGIGIARGVDLGLKARFGEGWNYFGGDLEFSLLRGMPSISITAGAHAYHDVGMDGMLNITFPFSRIVSLYTGADIDVEFNHDPFVLVWVPIGLQVMIRRNLGFIMEVDIAANEPASDMFALGLNIFF